MKILLVDDHALIRQALRAVLDELVPGCSIMEAADAQQAEQAIGGHPDLQLALLDVTLPDGDGLSLMGRLRQASPAVAVVILSAHQDRDRVLRALDLGASGFIPKSASRDVMVNALRLILAGGTYIPPEALSRTASGPEKQPDGLRVSPADLGLTDRQLDVLALVVQGKSNKWICRSLDLAEPTVKHHVTSILKALKVSNRTEAVVAVASLGWTLPKIS